MVQDLYIREIHEVADIFTLVVSHLQRSCWRCLAAAPALLCNAEPPQPTTVCFTRWAVSRVTHVCGVDLAEVVAS
jgi:hypothetical protein